MPRLVDVSVPLSSIPVASSLIPGNDFISSHAPAGDLLLQPYLARVETEGELSAIFIDGRLSHAVRKVPVHGDYRVQDDFGAHDEPTTLARDEIALAERAIRVAGTDLLYGRTDFLRADDGSLVLTELELVEPSMFFRHAPQAPDRLADALRARL